MAKVKFCKFEYFFAKALSYIVLCMLASFLLFAVVLKLYMNFYCCDAGRLILEGYFELSRSDVLTSEDVTNMSLPNVLKKVQGSLLIRLLT